MGTRVYNHDGSVAYSGSGSIQVIETASETVEVPDPTSPEEPKSSPAPSEE